MPNRLREEREKAGLSQQDLAKLCGWGQTAISRLENGERKLTLDKMIALGRALNIDPQQLMPGKSPINVNHVPKAGSMRVASILKGAFPTDRTLAVRGVAQGGGGRTYISPSEERPVDWTYRPPPLEGVDDAYALFVFDDSMDPMYKHGQTLWVHPHLPTIPGEGVVVVMQDDEVIVKELVRKTDKAITLRRYDKPKSERDFDIPAENVKTMHRVVGVYSGR